VIADVNIVEENNADGQRSAVSIISLVLLLAENNIGWSFMIAAILTYKLADSFMLLYIVTLSGQQQVMN